MSTVDHQPRIRERAYRLWEAQGRPEGRDMELWLAAEAEVAGEAGPKVPASAPARRKPTNGEAASKPVRARKPKATNA